MSGKITDLRNPEVARLDLLGSFTHYLNVEFTLRQIMTNQTGLIIAKPTIMPQPRATQRAYDCVTTQNGFYVAFTSER